MEFVDGWWMPVSLDELASLVKDGLRASGRAVPAAVRVFDEDGNEVLQVNISGVSAEVGRGPGR